MKIEKIAEGAYFVPSYSEQTIVWYPYGVTIQGLGFEEQLEDAEFMPIEEKRPFTKDDFEQGLKKSQS